MGSGSDLHAIRSWLANELGVPLEELQPEARWRQDLGIDVYTLHEVIESLKLLLGEPLPVDLAASPTVREFVSGVGSLLGERPIWPPLREATRHAS